MIIVSSRSKNKKHKNNSNDDNVLCEGYVQYSVSTVDLSSHRHQSRHYNDVRNTVPVVNMADTAERAVTVQVLDVNGTVVSRAANSTTGVLHVDNVQLWWPYTIGSPYLYTLKVLNCYIISRKNCC